MVEKLRSTCRHCGERVVFDRLKPIPESHSKYNAERPTMNIRRSEIWYHMEAEVGEEILCKIEEETLSGSRYSKRAQPRDYCVESVESAYSFRYCNRRVKDAKLFMCGIHARRERELLNKRAKEIESRELSNYVFTETLKLQERLKNNFGLDTKTDYDWRNHAYSGLVTINPRELLDFLEAYLPEEESF